MIFNFVIIKKVIIINLIKKFICYNKIKSHKCKNINF